MEFLQKYAIFIVPIIVLVLARILKLTIFYFKHSDRDFKYAMKHAMTYGHMPSVHTALMVSLVTSVGYYTGYNSGSFTVAVIIAILIIDDATRLRVYMGNLGKYINAITQKVDGIDNEKYPRLKERMGHRISEVIAGAIIGFALTVFLIQLIG